MTSRPVGATHNKQEQTKMLGIGTRKKKTANPGTPKLLLHFLFIYPQFPILHCFCIVILISIVLGTVSVISVNTVLRACGSSRAFVKTSTHSPNE